MGCAKECLQSNSFVHVTDDLDCAKDKEKQGEIQSIFSCSSHNTITEDTNVLVASPTVVDRSAFSLQRNPIKYIDEIPGSKTEISKNSPSKNTPAIGKRKLSQSKDQTLHTSTKKMKIPPTIDKLKNLCSPSKLHTKPNTLTILKDHTALLGTDKQKIIQTPDKTAKSVLSPSVSSTDMQHSKQPSGPNYRTEFVLESAKSQITIPSLSSNTEAVHSTMASSLVTTSKSSDNSLASDRKNPSVSTVSSIPSDMANSSGLVDMQSPFRGRQVKFSNISHGSNDNRTEKWGGQRKRISHFTHLSTLQVRKRHHDSDLKSKITNDPRSKKTKLT